MRPAAPASAPWLFAAPFAHRGLWRVGGAPENSTAAFEAAVRAGLGSELDVRLTRDGVPVVFHDDALDRMTDAAGPLGERTADDLRGVTLKGGGAIPRLADILALHSANPLLVEMKVSPGDEGPLEAAVAALLGDYRGKAAVMSFNPRSLALLAQAAPHIARGQLSTGAAMAVGGRTMPRTPDADDAGASISQPHFLSVYVDTLAAYGAPLANRLGVPLLAWTIRTPAHLQTARTHAHNWIFESLPVESVALAR